MSPGTPSHILGISAFFHDSAAALVVNGDVVAAAQEERFTRLKADAAFPELAVAYCLSEGRITAKNLDIVTFYEQPALKFDRLCETFTAFAPHGFDAYTQAIGPWASWKLDLPRVIGERLGDDFHGKLFFPKHHESHAASAFFPSPFDEAAILTLDAVGEWATSTIGHGNGNRLELLEELRFPHSLGMLYSAFTYYTGFKVNSGEYKVMGLAPYGSPRYVETILKEIVDLADDGSLWLDMSYFDYCRGATMTSEKFHRLFDGPPRDPESQISQKEMDLAASVQKVCEEAVLRAARHAQKLTESKNLVMAGGVALNCVANGRLLREGPFDRLWIQPAAGDAGGALGAALLAWHTLLGNPRVAAVGDAQKGSLLGPAFDEEDIKVFLDSVHGRYERIEDEDLLLDHLAQMLDDQKVIGWFQGRMEYGPRALGCRSIIGDARSPRMQQVMNLKIKFRESFRPFAPCVLREHAAEVFEMDPGEDSPYMLIVAPVREELRIPLDQEAKSRLEDPDLRIRVSVPRSSLPAITHIDYSARVQTVDEARHGRYYRLMRRFYERTGCPVIVNTSFNIRGEPIVCTPEDAYRCFMATAMDCLVLESFVLTKDEQGMNAVVDSEAYRAQYALD
jgi:carbamoyltransferase